MPPTLAAFDAANSPASVSSATLSPNPGSPSTIATVSRLTLITWPMKRRMYCGIGGAVGVVDDAAALVGFDAVLVDDPFEGGAVAARTGVESGTGRDS